MSAIQHGLAKIRTFSSRRAYFGWWVSIAGACNMVFSATPTFQAASVLFKAIEDEFGWSRTLISGIATFGRLAGTLIGPLEGWLTDTFGSGKMVLLGFTLGGAGLILFSRITGPLQCYFAFFLLSIGFSMGGFTPSLTASNAWMVNRRATAMSIVEGGVSVAALTVPLIVWGINEFGWRTTVMATGIIAILISPVLARIIGKRPTAEQLNTQIRIQTESASRRPRTNLQDFTPKEALRTRAFWSISITHMFVNLSTGAISAHLFLHLSDDNGVGLDAAAASAVIPIMGITAFVAQLGGGIIGDMANKRILVSVFALVQASALILLALADSFIMAATFAVTWGIGFGARTPMLLAMRGDYYGRRHFGTILGLTSFPMSLGMMITPVIVGWGHDIFHTYDLSLYVLAGFCALASITVLFATPPIPPELQRRFEARKNKANAEHQL